MYLVSSGMCRHVLLVLVLCTSFAATNTSPMSSSVCSPAGRKDLWLLFVLQHGHDHIPYCIYPSSIALWSFPWQRIGQGTLALCLGQRRGVCRSWRAVSSALAARKYWSLGLPVALQYCIAALVRLEIGPCCRSQGSGSWGPSVAPPWCLPHCWGLLTPTLINHCGGSNQQGLGVVNGEGAGAAPQHCCPSPRSGGGREHCPLSRRR